MRIQTVRVTHAEQSIWGYLAEREKTLPLVTPLDVYDQFKETRGSWFWDSGTAIVRIEADDGTVGSGWCEDGCRLIGNIIDRHLSRLLVGQSPFEVEGLWDRLFRASIPYGRKGAALEAISAIDIALWDLMGRALGKPVYELLGGPVRETIPVYASALHPVEPEQVAREAKQYVNQGYQAVKTRFPCGPGDGIDGMRRNEEHIAHVRQAVGDTIDLMADAYMGWELPYAVRMCRRLEPYNLAWIEEPFIPDDLTSYARLKRETSIPISGGEHEFSRFGFQEIIDRQAMDIIQPDLRRCGGFTEARKITALASTAGLPVVPHGYGITHLHFAAAMPNVPLLEHFPLPCWADPPPSDWQPLFLDEPLPQQGRVKLASRPGLGITINDGTV